MKNILVIDGAANCAYDLFKISEEDFSLIFKEEGQNIQFVEDLDLENHPQVRAVLTKMWKNPIKKENVNGINALFFFGLSNKKQFYPKKRDDDLDLVGRAFATKDL